MARTGGAQEGQRVTPTELRKNRPEQRATGKSQPDGRDQMRAGSLEGVAGTVGLVRSLPPSWRYRWLGFGMQLWQAGGPGLVQAGRVSFQFRFGLSYS